MQQEQDALRTWRFFERGVLPRAGGWAEQDARFAQVIETIEPAVVRAREDLARRAQALRDHGDPG